MVPNHIKTCLESSKFMEDCMKGLLRPQYVLRISPHLSQTKATGQYILETKRKVRDGDGENWFNMPIISCFFSLTNWHFSGFAEMICWNFLSVTVNVGFMCFVIC